MTFSSQPIGRGPIGSSAIGGLVPSTGSYTLSASTGAFDLHGYGTVVAQKVLTAAAGDFSLALNDQALSLNKPIDLYWDQTVLLLHADDFTDAKKGAVTKIGNPSIDMSIKKFGTGSISMPNEDNNYIRLADSDNWRFRSAPFTIEGWYRFTNYHDGTILVAQWYYGFAFWFADGNQLYFRTWTGDTAKYAFVPENNRWYHFAVDRDASNVVRIYVDGVMVSKTLNFTNDINGSGYPLSIGTLEPTSYGLFLSGNYDEIRITKGVARYASDSGFALQTKPFGTGLLTAGAGAFSSSGGEVAFERSQPTLFGRSAPYYLFGRAANLSSAGFYRGEFTLSASNAALIYRVPTRLSASSGAFSAAGAEAILRRGWVRKVSVGHFLMHGGNAVMQRPLRDLPAEGGEWAVDPQTAGMRHKWLLRLSGVSYALSGSTSTYWRSRRLLAARGALSLNLIPAQLRISWRTPLEPGRLVLEGRSISAYWRGRLRVEAGAFVSTGYAISMRQSHRLVAASTTFAWTGLDANLVKGLTVFGQHGAFSLAGVDAKKQILRKGRPTRYLLVGNGAIIWSGWGGDATGTVTSAAAVASVSSGQARGWVSAPRAQGAWSDQ